MWSSGHSQFNGREEVFFELKHLGNLSQFLKQGAGLSSGKINVGDKSSKPLSSLDASALSDSSNGKEELAPRDAIVLSWTSEDHAKVRSNAWRRMVQALQGFPCASQFN